MQELGGLLFTYMGPQPAPLLPCWDVLVRPDGTRRVEMHPVLEANWLQPMENSVDTVHTYFLHGHMMKQKGLNVGQYYLRPILSYDFELCRWGVLKRRTYGGDKPETEKGHPLIFPNALRVPTGPFAAMHWRVPINDEQTQIVVVDFEPTADGSEPEVKDLPPRYVDPGLLPNGEYDMLSFPCQDKMAYETAGAIFDRSEEHLSASDRGIILYRRLLFEQIDLVEQGGEPMNVFRDPAENVCLNVDTSQGPAQEEWLDEDVANYYRATAPAPTAEAGAGSASPYREAAG